MYSKFQDKMWAYGLILLQTFFENPSFCIIIPHKNTQKVTCAYNYAAILCDFIL